MMRTNPKLARGEPMEVESRPEGAKEPWSTPTLEVRGDLLTITLNAGGAGPGDSYFSEGPSGG